MAEWKKNPVVGVVVGLVIILTIVLVVLQLRPKAASTSGQKGMEPPKNTPYVR